MDLRSELIDGAAPADARTMRAGAARWLNGWSKMLHYATVFTFISVTMIIVGFGSILASLWNDDD
jgi:hypothetical protein